jgi:eukaryotic-like serine/threonine-protein kinase
LFAFLHFAGSHVNKSDWERRMTLFDTLVAMPDDARHEWLNALRFTEPVHVDALEKMLSEYERDESVGDNSSAHGSQVTLLGVGTNSFEAVLSAATEVDNPALNAGDDVGAWRLAKKIGEGGMGAVWLADRHDGNFEGRAAIKFLRTGLGKTDVVKRFLRERRLLARLQHPNIARLLDAGAHQGEPYLVMEYVDGETITQWATVHSQTVTERVALILKVCRAVEHAHGQLIVHRDLKPSNVLVGANGEPALLDFGIAKLIDDEDEEYGTALTRMTGRGYTLGYCAPEQITGEPTGVAADVFSIGVLLFEMLSGTMPFKPEHEGRQALEHAIVHTDARTLGRALDNPDSQAAMNRPRDADQARGDLEAIVGKSLRRNPVDRYATVSALAADLEAWLAQTPISIRAEDRRYRSQLWLKRNWIQASLGAVASIAVTAGLAISLWQRGEAIAAAKLANEEAARATKVADYLGELIQSASPDNHGGKWPTVLALLEKSEKDLEKQFAADPKTHALLLKKLADTNDALNRNAVALAQLTELVAILQKTQPADSTDALEAERQRAQLLRRMNRFIESLAIEEELTPRVIARYGMNSEEYGKLLLGKASLFSNLGRISEARKTLADGAAIITKFNPNDLAKRVDLVNDAAVLLTRLAMWREAMNTLATIESDLTAMANLGGQRVRDALIIRRNLEAIRVRVGNYDGVETRLQKILIETDQLLGKGNVQSALVMSTLRTFYFDTGRFAESLQIVETLAPIQIARAADVPDEAIDAEILLVMRQMQFGRAPNPPAAVQLPKLLEKIRTNLPEAAVTRAQLYRPMSDAAIEAGLLSLADTAQQRARADLATVPNPNPETATQIDRSAALVAYRRGEPKRAVALLTGRFQQFDRSAEGDTPRRAGLWLQRAIYELEYDAKVAAVSLAESRAIFARAGGVQPHLAVLVDYVDARLAGNPAAIRAAEDKVDRAWLRTRKTPWQIPVMPNL